MKKEKKDKQPKDINKVLLRILLICTILCFLLGGILYIVGIRRVLPIILILVLASLSSIIIFLLARETLSMKKNKLEKKSIQKHA